MRISTSCALANFDILAEDIHKGNLLLARAGTVLTQKVKRALVGFGVQNVKIKK